MQNGIIILAAGKGTRMKSQLPKVLHNVGGKPMVEHLIDRAHDLNAKSPIVIYGHEGEKLKNTLSHHDITWVEQAKQLGTGHAVMQTLSFIDDQTTYLILVGDAPLIQTQTLIQLTETSHASGIAVLTVNLENPFGYGRIVRNDNNHVERIVEQKDASNNEQLIQEINSGVFAIRGDVLKKLLPLIENNNVQEEYYLTDIVALANQHGHAVTAHQISTMDEVLGCNNKIQLAQLERIYQRRIANQLMTDGVTLADPARIDVRGNLKSGEDSFIDVNCVFEGEVTLGKNVTIEANCIIRNTNIGSNTRIKANTIIEDSVIGKNADIGPFARLRPQTQLADNTKVGNFVETKNAKVASGAKINHLSYVGDAVIGENVNVGAGTITCNYDGANKFETVIKKNAFIGSNSALVAPVTIGENATIAAGSTITKNVDADILAITRSKQAEIKNWKRPSKKNK
ncbi:MAG: bifunctional UDP-N-acetylglucosamine diphosphorylase/glucosamine-1-phosphate N-acetyltransferase GlmU [Gammaproteobacteria bacterium]|nr:bifunctional UDP-N-acetylglucosamine diphosphorylase/glucosamine-1-phosphate N-acetyltransferase GlmU [Gammaproteobacteria bacterium]